MEESILLIKQPIVVKTLAEQMGIRPPQMIRELIERNVFVTIKHTIKRDVAESILKAHAMKYKFVD